jgi:large subunit ribosomal protein L3
MAGLIGKKLGMTQIFTDNGAAVPVTVVQAGPCPVVQVKNPDDNGYAAVQLGFGSQKEKNSSKAERGHAAKASLDYAPELLKEFKVSDPSMYEVGQNLTVEQFQPGDKIKVVGNTKGRGFQGVVKRHGFRGRPGSHGHPKARNPGTLGPGTNPSRVIKGKKMPGQYGDEQMTAMNLRVEKIDAERNLIYIRGGVPGARNSVLYIKKA